MLTGAEIKNEVSEIKTEEQQCAPDGENIDFTPLAVSASVKTDTTFSCEETISSELNDASEREHFEFVSKYKLHSPYSTYLYTS